MSLEKNPHGNHDKVAVFKKVADSPVARREFAESLAPTIKQAMVARNKDNFESRSLRRAMGCAIRPDSIVDTFATVDDEDRRFGVTAPGEYFFDDEELRYHGPYESRPEAIAAARENIRQIAKRTGESSIVEEKDASEAPGTNP